MSVREKRLVGTVLGAAAALLLIVVIALGLTAGRFRTVDAEQCRISPISSAERSSK